MVTISEARYIELLNAEVSAHDTPNPPTNRHPQHNEKVKVLKQAENFGICIPISVKEFLNGSLSFVAASFGICLNGRVKAYNKSKNEKVWATYPPEFIRYANQEGACS